MNHFHIKYTPHPLIWPLSPQNIHHSSPLYPCPTYIHRWPIVVGGRQNSSQLLEWRYFIQQHPSLQENRPRMFFLLQKNLIPYLPLQLVPTHIWVRVRPFECLIGILGAPGEGLIPFLQYYYAVPRVLVGKVHPDVCPWEWWPQNLSTGHINQEKMAEKDTLCCTEVLSLTLSSPSTSSPPQGGGGLDSPQPTPHCLWQWVVINMDAILNLHWGECNLCYSHCI